MLLRSLFWGSFGALVWTHAGYPLAAAGLARLRCREVRRADVTPSVTVIVPAHDEEKVIGRRLANLLALDYPAEALEIVIASDGSRDRTEEIVAGVAAADRRVRLVRCPRAGKVAALNRAARGAAGEVIAFSDANTTWARDALAKLVRSLADPTVGYVCGRLELEPSGGTNREGVYWRYELWLREQESALGSITGGNGAIYAVRRDDYVEDRFGHDLGFPHLMVRRGLRAAYDPDAVAYEKPSRDLGDEYRRKVRMFVWDWQHVLEGRMLEGVGPLYAFEVVSHRLLRYSSGLLHLHLLGTSVALARRRPVYASTLAAQLAFGALAAAGRRRAPLPGSSLAYYYVLVTWATVEALARYLRWGVPPVW
jgi:cellulose synthase/poly-beta-1,6-N-acetylglucosamine synthase-like glycosyltransferase